MRIFALRVLALEDGLVKTQLMEIFVKRNVRWLVEAYHNVDVKTRH